MSQYGTYILLIQDNAYSVLDILTSIIRLKHSLTSLYGISISNKLLVALPLPLTGTSYQLAVAKRNIDDEPTFTKPIKCCLHVLRAFWCVDQCAQSYDGSAITCKNLSDEHQCLIIHCQDLPSETKCRLRGNRNLRLCRKC